MSQKQFLRSVSSNDIGHKEVKSHKTLSGMAQSTHKILAVVRGSQLYDMGQSMGAYWTPKFGHFDWFLTNS